MFTLSTLPYAKDALAPHISAETMEFHYGKHHARYVKTLNELIEGTPMAHMELEDIIMRTNGAHEGIDQKIFNNAAQVWNHDFFWASMKPDGGGAPDSEVADFLAAEFGDTEGFKSAFLKAAEEHFGSGYVWLVDYNGRAEILTTPNAELPITSGKIALLTCDLWEHAYYLDYQNRKPDFVQSYLKHLINWDFAAANLHIPADA